MQHKGGTSHYGQDAKTRPSNENIEDEVRQIFADALKPHPIKRILAHRGLRWSVMVGVLLGAFWAGYATAPNLPTRGSDFDNRPALSGALAAGVTPKVRPAPTAIPPNKANAALHGQSLERIIETTLSARGFSPVRHRDWAKDPAAHPEHLLLLDAPYTTIYGGKGRTEFVLKSPRLSADIRIEAKWQQSRGSTDEKLPYLFVNAATSAAIPEQRVVIVIDGPGWRPGAVAWLRRAAAHAPDGKRIDVMDLGQFMAWSNSL